MRNHRSLNIISLLIIILFLLLISACLGTESSNLTFNSEVDESISQTHDSCTNDPASTPTLTTIQVARLTAFAPTPMPTSTPEPIVPVGEEETLISLTPSIITINIPPLSSTKALDSYGEFLNTGFPNPNRINDIAIDSFGNIWTATTFGVVKWDLNNNTYRWYKEDDGLPDNWIRSIEVSTDGTIWAGSKKLSFFDGNRWIVPTSHYSSHGSEIAIGDEGQFWVGDYSGLYQFDGSNLSLIIDHILVESMVLGQNGSLWIGTHNGEVYHLMGDQWTRHKLIDVDYRIDVKSIDITDDGKVWAGSVYGGVYNFDGTSWKEVTEVDCSGGKAILSLATGPDNTIWMGKGDGLFFYDGFFIEHYTFSDGLYTAILSVLPTEKYGVWLGSYYGLIYFDGTNWTTYFVDFDYDIPK